jgi:hypothetical protein
MQENSGMLDDQQEMSRSEDFEAINKNKREAEMQLSKVENKDSYTIRAETLLRQISQSPKTWSDIQASIEDFRNNVNKRDIFSGTATPVQIGMASILFILFELVVATDLLIEPVDVNIIINTFKSNFNTDAQLEALELLTKELE